jgi:AcrR family transcriptional regulator
MSSPKTRAPPPAVAEKLYEAGADLTPNGPVNVEAVARAAGVPRATLYYYFPGRDSLLDWITLEDLRRRALGIADAEGDPGRPKLLAMLMAIGRLFAGRPALAVRLMSVLTSDSASEALQAEAQARLMTPLRLAIGEGLSAGKIRIGSRDADVALALVSGLASVVAMRVNRGETQDLDWIIEGLARQLLDVFAPAPV